MTKTAQKVTGRVLPHSMPAPTVAPSGHSGSEFKHTPGPWFITNNGRFPIHVGAKDGRWKHVPGTLLAEVGGNLTVGTGNFQEDLANANLISAAPDLLEMVILLEKSIVWQMECDRRNGDDEGARMKILSLNMARAAIAKAKGDRVR